MPEAPTKAEKTEAKAARPYAVVQAELDKAAARLRELHPKVETESRFATFKAEQDRKLREVWDKQNPGMPYPEPEREAPEANTALQREFHSLHYEVARLDGELKQAQIDRLKA